MVLCNVLAKESSELVQLKVKSSKKKRLNKVVILNLYLLVVLIPLEIKCHTVPHLKALTRGIEHRSGHGQASIFRWQKISLKSTHFTS